VLHKGDTICITYDGREYLIDIVETKPEDVIVCVEADINLEFEAPKDYVEPKPVPVQDSKKQKADQE
jgi:ubiquitin fusion degradation protein 1